MEKNGLLQIQTSTSVDDQFSPNQSIEYKGYQIH